MYLQQLGTRAKMAIDGGADLPLPLNYSFADWTLIFWNLNLNSLLVKRQIDNPSPGAVTGGN